MKFTLSWLKDHLDTDASLEDISAALTRVGLEVEDVTNPGEALKDFVVGEILTAAPHPDADKLQVCTVSDGSQTLTIVCGAPNARQGLKVVLAREGVHIPAANFTIKKTKIRGQESCGMLCSEDELGLSDGESEGILELPADAPVGAPVTEVLGLDDPVFDIAITPNRGDCLGVRGVARDLAATGLGALRPLIIEDEQGSFIPSVKVSIDVEEDCPQFIGCEIKGVKNTPSPDWLQQRLKAIGLRPISALVDITNYISFNLGRPLHVYDIDKLQGNITVRHARDGEKLEALNGKTYALKAGMTVIADDVKVLGLGGIVGGEESGCTLETTRVFLEVALFNPINIANTGRALQIDSDARYRFERTVDPAGVATGVEQAIRLITQLCGGEVSELEEAGHQPNWQRTITFNPERVHSLGGVSLPVDDIRRILRTLGMQMKETSSNAWEVKPPSWRPDIEGEADLVEEVLRINGYDEIPVTALPASNTKPVLTFVEKASGLAKRALATRGFQEARTWAFMKDSTARLFAEHNPALELANPISADLNYMRPTLLPNLVEAAGRNKARGFSNVRLFEVGSQFAGITPDQQSTMATGIRTGETGPKQPHEQPRAVDVYDAKADALAVLAASGFDASKVQVSATAPDYYHPGRSGTLSLGPKIILGYFGELHPLTLQKLDYKGRVVAFELFLNAIPAPKSKGSAKPMLKASDYQAVDRDFAFIANNDVQAVDVLKAIRAADAKLIQDVRIFDIYQGKGMEPGKQSIAVTITLQAPDRTLTDAEIEGVAKKVVENASKNFGGVLRG